ncbi:MAG: pyruvate dehydrogenase [Candidatus Rokubacteria bacterium]|nr:pyruvate dehydrogenase [Candidatus Rokubacteria bacterium]
MMSLETLRSIEKRVLWLASFMVHHANNVRPNPDGTKVGGHQASSASLVSVLTALYFGGVLRADDLVALKAHASPAFYAIQYLRGRLDADDLRALRSFGGLQAYPSRRKNPEIVELSTGSMGLGAVAATFAALAGRYLDDRFGVGSPAHVWVMVGDAELDEGNVWEALLEEVVPCVPNVTWIVDLNRQSLDRITPDARPRQLAALFEANGWDVIDLRWGSGVASHDRLRARLEALPHTDYHRLLRRPAGELRKALVTGADGGIDRALDAALAALSDATLAALVADVGGHDLARVLDALARARANADRPTMILAHTVKGWGTPLAADPLNHTALMTTAQIEAVRDTLGVTAGDEWARFADDSAEARLIGALPPLFSAPPARRPDPEIPDALGERFAGETSTQEAFGRVLGALGRLPAADHIVTVSADVSVTTHIAGWITRKGVWFPRAKTDAFADLPQPVQWKESPRGQHIELGIAEHNLFLLLGALGLMRELSGVTLLPIGTLYDPFVTRGLDALYHALYAGGRFIVAATPSGVSLSPEGGAHQSVITPGIGVTLPAIAFYEPVFAQDVEWILLHGLRALVDRRDGESLYLRLSTRPISQALAPPPSEGLRAAAVRGAYRLIDARTSAGYAPDRAVNIFAAGVMVPEAVAAARRLADDGVFASVIAVTSSDRLYRDLRNPRPYLHELVTADEEDVPVVSALDGHSHALAFLGGALGVTQIALGADDFGQSGTRADLYRQYGIDADALAAAAHTLLG